MKTYITEKCSLQIAVVASFSNVLINIEKTLKVNNLSKRYDIVVSHMEKAGQKGALTFTHSLIIYSIDGQAQGEMCAGNMARENEEGRG